MASSELKRDIRARLLRWKLSVKHRDKKEEQFTSNVFKDLDNLLETIYYKYDGSVRFHESHKIMDIWPMTERFLTKVHNCICRRLRSSPTTASPYFCVVTREVSREVFEVCKEIMEHNSFGHITTATRARFTITITDIRKAIYFFNRINAEGVIIEKHLLLKKVFSDGSEAKVHLSTRCTGPLPSLDGYKSQLLYLKYVFIPA
jgi:hypothetical protein